MKKFTLMFVCLMSLFLVVAVANSSDEEYQEKVYYETPHPAVRKHCNPCNNHETTCRYAAWYGRFEPAGKTVWTCDEFSECSWKVVPASGKEYSYFIWNYRQSTCY